MTISSSTFIQDTTLFLRQLISGNVTDPLGAGRSSDSAFVLTSYPEKTVNWPIITVQNTNLTTRNLGMGSEKQLANVGFEIRCWGRKVSEKDKLSQEVTDALRDNQRSGSGTINEQMYDYDILSATSVDEAGKNNPKSKVINIQYSVVL